MSRHIIRFAVSALTALIATHAGAAPSASPPPTLPPCAATIRSADDAARKSDWIVEALVSDTFTPSSNPEQLELILSEMDRIKGDWPSRRHATGAVLVGDCYAGKRDSIGQLLGKRMRLFGSKHLSSPARQVFYIEAASTRFTPAQAPAPLATKVNRTNASNPIGGGWHRAHSGAGQFSIDMPAPFHDATAAMEGKVGALAGHILRATDSNGTTYLAVLEPNGEDRSMAGTFDRQVMHKRGTAIRFKGTKAVRSKSVEGSMIMHSIMFRAPGGTYLLGVATTPDREQESASARERFYQSFAFD